MTDRGRSYAERDSHSEPPAPSLRDNRISTYESLLLLIISAHVFLAKGRFFDLFKVLFLPFMAFVPTLVVGDWDTGEDCDVARCNTDRW